ncbi:hypothetical protein BH10ACT7_BH10ACT7_22320 [soil metagenome]
MNPMTRESANLSLMLGIVFVVGAAILIPVGIFLAFFGISASIGFIVAGLVVGGGAAWLILTGRRALRHLNSSDQSAS